VQDNPAPGSYDVAKSFHYTQDKIEPRPPRNEAARRRHEAFLSSAERFGQLTDTEFAEADQTLPGQNELQTHQY